MAYEISKKMEKQIDACPLVDVETFIYNAKDIHKHAYTPLTCITHFYT